MPSLAEALESGDPSARLQAAMDAGTRPDPSFVPVLVDRCGIEPDFNVREMLTWALVRNSSDETLRLVAKHRREVERVYTMFPRLAERKSNGGAQLSGGEQQMLAIGRALLLEPRLLVMDEPTEGLAPVIVDQVADALRHLAADSGIGILLIEQNLGVAIAVADRIGRRDGNPAALLHGRGHPVHPRFPA